MSAASHNHDPSASRNHQADRPQAVNLGETYGVGEYYAVRGQTFDLGERLSPGTSSSPVIIKTRTADAQGNPDPGGTEEDWWIQNGVVLNLRRAITKPNAPTHAFSLEHVVEQGFPSELEVGTAIPMPAPVSDTRVIADKTDWRPVTVEAVLATRRHGIQPGQPHSSNASMEKYAKLFLEARGTSPEAYTVRAARRLESAKTDNAAREKALGVIAAGWAGSADRLQRMIDRPQR
jgi:hypothetical protein